MSSEAKVDQFLGERNGQQLRADVYEVGTEGYSISYYINGDFVKEEVIKGHSISYIQDACNNWLNGIKVLNG